MLSVLSPAKQFDCQHPLPPAADGIERTQPVFSDRAAEFASLLGRFSASELGAYMGISPRLAQLNHDRYRAFSAQKEQPALFAFQGDVYRALDAGTLNGEALAFAGRHLRILSGLYGLLAPYDTIRAHRLEMGLRPLLSNAADNLALFWRPMVTEALLTELEKHANPVLVNLASRLYAQVLDAERFADRLIQVEFVTKNSRTGTVRTIGLRAKKGRGLMARYIVSNMIDRPEDLKGFSDGGYRFQPGASDETRLVFLEEPRQQN